MKAGRTVGDGIEGIAVEIYRKAGADPRIPADPAWLADRVLGAGAVEVLLPGAILAPGELARDGMRWRIYLRAGLLPERRAHVIGHELAHWALRGTGLDDEPTADRLGAAILLPRPSCARLLRGFEQVKGLAEAIGASQTLVTLRLGEACRVPVAVVGPTRVRVRGGCTWGEQVARRAAMCPPVGVSVHAITDAPRRVALVGAVGSVARGIAKAKHRYQSILRVGVAAVPA